MMFKVEPADQGQQFVFCADLRAGTYAKTRAADLKYRLVSASITLESASTPV